MAPIELIGLRQGDADNYSWLPFDKSDAYERDWWDRQPHQYDQDPWCVLALRDDVEVGRVILAGSRQMSLREYGIDPQLAELALEIVFFEVACQYRRQGIGREIVRALCRRYPDRRLVAFSEGADEFWDSVGQRHEHKGLIEPRNRPLFIMERATSDGA